MGRHRYTYEQQRQDIQGDINSFFGRTIQITPRAMAGLQAGEPSNTLPEYLGPYGEGPGAFAYCIMDSLIRSSPGCAMLLFHAGAMLENLKFQPQLDRPAPLSATALEILFEGDLPREHTRRTPTARRVTRTGVLTDYDILTSALEAALQGNDYMDFGGAVLKAAGLKEPRHRRWSPASHWRGYHNAEEATQWSACDEYLKRILRRVKTLKTADPSRGFIQFALYEDDSGAIRVRPFGLAGISKLSLNPPIQQEREYVYRGGILQPVSSVAPGASDDVLAELEELINSRRALESDFQRFFKQHPFLLTGLDFSRAHPQPVLYQDDGTSLIPDFFLEKLDGGWDAILDLKRPYEDMVIRRRNRVYFSQEIHNAAAQLRYYSEWFDSSANRRAFESAYGVRTFRPKMVIVVGRIQAFRDDVERIRLIGGFPNGLDLWTYDDLHRRAQRYLDFVKRRVRIP